MKNLLGRLMGRSFDELKQIASSWQIPLLEQNHNDAAIAIYRDMGEKAAMRSVWYAMDPAAQEFMRWLLGQRSYTARIEDLPTELDRPMEEIRPALDAVVGLGLADIEETLMRGNRVVSAGDNLYNWGARNLTPPEKKIVVSVSNEVFRTLGAVLEELDSGDPSEEPMSVLLDRLDQTVLEGIANRWNLPDLRYMTKPSLVEMLDELLGSRQVRTQMLSELSPETQGLFELICRLGGRVDAAEIMRLLGRTDRELRHIFAPLEANALAFETLWGGRLLLFVPRQVLDPGSAGRQQVGSLEQVAAPALAETRLPIELTWDLLTMLAYFKQNEVAHNLHNGELPRRALKRITESFLHPSEPGASASYLRLLLHFAEALELTHEEETTRRLLSGAKLEEWTRMPFASQTIRLFRRWVDDRRLREDPAQPFYIWRTPDLTAARKRLVRELLSCPVGTWLSIDSLLRRIQTADPHLLYSKDEVLRHGGVPAVREFEANWMKNEGHLLRGMLIGVLHWFGVVDLGRTDDVAGSFRITRAGANLIDHPDKAEEPNVEQKPFLVQPNFEVLVLAPESRPLWTLLLCSDLVRHDRVSVYSLNKDSILRSRSDGLTVAQLQEFLKTNSNKQIPQNVVQCISDWSRGYKRALVQKATLLEVEEPEMLDELLASRRLRGYTVRRLTSTVAMINMPRSGQWARDDPWQKLAKELRSVGFFPELAEEQYAEEETADSPVAADRPPSPTTSAVSTANGASANKIVSKTQQPRPARKGRFPAA